MATHFENKFTHFDFFFSNYNINSHWLFSKFVWDPLSYFFFTHQLKNLTFIIKETVLKSLREKSQFKSVILYFVLKSRNMSKWLKSLVTKMEGRNQRYSLYVLYIKLRILISVNCSQTGVNWSKDYTDFQSSNQDILS